MIKPLLADEALVLVDDAIWPLVQQAHGRFLRGRPGWSVVRRWDARHNDDALWANGLHALRFRRAAGASQVLAPTVRVALFAQRVVVGPLRRTVWRSLTRMPLLVPLAKRLEPKSQHQIGGVGSEG